MPAAKDAHAFPRRGRAPQATALQRRDWEDRFPRQCPAPSARRSFDARQVPAVVTPSEHPPTVPYFCNVRQEPFIRLTFGIALQDKLVLVTPIVLFVLVSLRCHPPHPEPGVFVPAVVRIRCRENIAALRVQHAVVQTPEAHIDDESLVDESLVKVVLRSAFARLGQFLEGKAPRKAAVGQKDKDDDIVAVQPPRLWYGK